MAIYEPPTNYFSNINFNNDFYQIPNDTTNGISIAYANSHYLLTTGGTTAKSHAYTTLFDNDVVVTNGGISALNVNGSSITGANITGDSLNAYINLTVGSLAPSATYCLDIANGVVTSGCRIRTTATNGYLTLMGGTSGSSLGSITFHDGFGGPNGSIGGDLVNGSYINMNTVFGITSGYSITGNLLASGTCGISTATLNTNAVLDVGGTTTSTKYTFLNGLRISGRDANTIWQNITTSNINITTSGSAQTIGFNIGNGNPIASVNSTGIYIQPNKGGLGIGTTPPSLANCVAVTNNAQAGIMVDGTNSRIALNSDTIRLGFASGTGIYSASSIANDFIILNTTGRILFNPNNSTYCHILLNNTNNGTTNFVNTATGVTTCSIGGLSGSITCGTLISSSNISTAGYITITGGTPGSSGSYAASAGTQVGGNVTISPTGYLLWGGGNNSAVVAYSVAAGTNYSIKADYAVIAGGFISVSDKRIKRDIKTIDNSLEIIEKIEPRNYNIIETAANKYGFIAQEVEEVIPNSVNLSNDFIPNIFDYADYNDKVITFDNKNDLEIVVGDEVKINYESCRVEEVIDKNTFKIHKKLETDENKKVFIMGTKVYDFKCIDYNSIAAINTAAIKELYKIIKQQQEQIESLRLKLG